MMPGLLNKQGPSMPPSAADSTRAGGWEPRPQPPVHRHHDLSAQGAAAVAAAQQLPAAVGDVTTSKPLMASPALSSAPAAARAGASPLGQVAEFGLNVVRVCALVMVAPLLLPALLLRRLGLGSLSVLATVMLTPLMLWWSLTCLGEQATRASGSRSVV